MNRYGSEQQLVSGTLVSVNESYIRESILNPQRQIVAGYQPLMPTFQGLVDEEGVLALVEYVKTLAGPGGADLATLHHLVRHAPEPPPIELP